MTKVNACGQPVYGEDTSVVTKGFTSISVTANLDETDEINVPNASGERCVYEPSCTSLLNYEVEIEFCQVDPALFGMLTGQEVIYDEDGVAIGFKVCSDVNSCAGDGFALEIWTGAPGSTCVVDADGNISTSAQPGGYILFPYLTGGTFGDFTIENAEITFTLTGAQSKEGSLWGSGPHPTQWDPTAGENGSYVPATTFTVDSCDHLIVTQTTTPAPTPYCGPIPTLDPTQADVEDFEAAAGAQPNTMTFSPLPEATDPFWVDFGDGEWDYSEDGSDLSHQYTSPGTYTVTVYRGGTSVSKQVTVGGTS